MENAINERIIQLCDAAVNEHDTKKRHNIVRQINEIIDEEAKRSRQLARLKP
jgi:hypothetical protein